MPKIEAWKCPHTGKLFEDEKPYRAHLRRQARARLNQRKWQTVLAGINDVIVGAQQVNNCQELVDYIIANHQEFIISGLLNDFRERSQLQKIIKQGWDLEFPRILIQKICHQACLEFQGCK